MDDEPHARARLRSEALRPAAGERPRQEKRHVRARRRGEEEAGERHRPPPTRRWRKNHLHSRGHRRFDLGASRQRRDRAIAQGRERRRDIGEARRGEGIAAPRIFGEKGAVEAVARSGRVDRLDRMRSRCARGPWASRPALRPGPSSPPRRARRDRDRNSRWRRDRAGRSDAPRRRAPEGRCRRPASLRE